MNPMVPVVPHAPAPPAGGPSERLMSLDAFRGAIMMLMASAGLGVSQAAKEFPDSAWWRFFGHQCEHSAWAGCTLWDLIQPAFMFMVGVALPWSIANRQARGQSFLMMLGHAVWRALALVLLGVFLTSAWSQRTDWSFPIVLAQIGLGYAFLFLVGFMKPGLQWVVAFSLLVAYWFAFATHPLPLPGFDWKAVGVPDDWPHLDGFSAHWEKNANFAATFDLWFLNRFPRGVPFTHNAGGYQTLNFIPSLATMTFGLIAGRWLRAEVPLAGKLRWLTLAGLGGIVLGKLLELMRICTIIKPIWTPSWALFSAGIVAILLAGFVALIDGRGWRRWAFPLVVAGMNPTALYCLWQLSSGFVRETIKTHLGQDIFQTFGILYVPALQRASTLMIFWLILWWMYRRRIFLRI